MSFEELAAGEHQHLSKILEDVVYLAQRASYLQAARRFGEFRHLLEMHVTAEERVVLPLFIERTGDPTGMGDRLRIEHSQILHFVEGIASAISQWDRNGFSERVVQLNAALEAHNRNEAAVLHPALNDLIATATDWRRLCASAGVNC
jgi:hemerythrin superfamily protein